MKNLLLALLVTFPFIVNASEIIGDSFKVNLPTSFGKVIEKKKKTELPGVSTPNMEIFF